MLTTRSRHRPVRKSRWRVATLALAGVLAAALAPAAAGAKTVVLADGHIDAGSARIVHGKLHSYIKDATGPTVIWRDPASVVIRVVNGAKVKLPSGMSFIGSAGQTVWMIPQVQKQGVIWAGWNTEEITSKQIRGGITWKLRKVTGPGRVVLFQTGSFGDEHVLFNSGHRLPQSYVIPPGTHAHGNWAFTKKGTYKMAFTMSITTASGKHQSDDATLTYKVG